MRENGPTTSPPLGGILRTMSAMLSRMGLAGRLGTSFEGKRNLYETLGYPPTLTYEHFLLKVVRQDIACRIVRAFPADTWREAPQVTDDDSAKTPTPFEQAWRTLEKRLQLYATCERLDRLACIGEYAVLLLGLRDGQPLSAPVRGRRLGDQGLLYATPYAQRYADIVTFVQDVQSPDFGRPETYQLNLSRTRDTTHRTAGGGTVPVHASRCLHFVEDPWEDTVYGLPKLQPIYNRLEDLEKLAGGSAEMFWLGALRGMVMGLKEGYSLSAEDKAVLNDEIEEYMHGLRRWIAANGLEVTALQQPLSSPKEHIEAIVQLLCGALGIPQRKLFGSERGELASSQDERNWNAQIITRQKNCVEPRILRPLLDTLIRYGILPPPQGGEYQVLWPDLLALSDQERATVARDYATALSTYAGPGQAELVVPVAEFREKFLGVPPEVEGLEELPLPEDDARPPGAGEGA